MNDCFKRLMVSAVAFLAMLQAGCSDNVTPDSGVKTGGLVEPSSTYHVDAGSSEPTYNPLGDLDHKFESFQSSEEPPFNDDIEKNWLVCAGLAGDACVQSDDCVIVQNNANKMIVHGTWNPQDRVVYIGLQSIATGERYVWSFTGGSVSAVINLTDVPIGEYYVILSSNDNPSIVCALAYQVI